MTQLIENIADEIFSRSSPRSVPVSIRMGADDMAELRRDFAAKSGMTATGGDHPGVIQLYGLPVTPREDPGAEIVFELPMLGLTTREVSYV